MCLTVARINCLLYDFIRQHRHPLDSALYCWNCFTLKLFYRLSCAFSRSIISLLLDWQPTGMIGCQVFSANDWWLSVSVSAPLHFTSAKSFVWSPGDGNEMMGAGSGKWETRLQICNVLLLPWIRCINCLHKKCACNSTVMFNFTSSSFQAMWCPAPTNSPVVVVVEFKQYWQR